MKYLNAALLISILFFVSSIIYYNDKVTQINTDFSKNYWLHTDHQALAGDSIEYLYTGAVVDSSYEGSLLRIKLANKQGEKEFLLDDVMQSKYLESISEGGRGFFNLSVSRHNDGFEQINNISFSKADVQ